MKRNINFVVQCSTNQLFGNRHSKLSVLCIQTQNTHRSPLWRRNSLQYNSQFLFFIWHV